MRTNFQICNRRREYWGMFSLQSDFLRHSLAKLLGLAELRPLICSCTFLSSSIIMLIQLVTPCSNSPQVRLRQIPSKFVLGRLG